ncbi:MAG TPA: porin family protein [Chitinophagaceae bacterium]|nr:porin family protein [Chitinophagaceae bacterium]
MALFISGITALQAQSGVILKGGVNLANVSVNSDGDVNDANTLTSFHLGFSGDFSLADIISFQPGILFTGKGSKVQRGDENSATYRRETFNPMYLEIPANVVLKLPVGTGTKFFVGAGPYLGVGIAGKRKLEARIGGVTTEAESDIEYATEGEDAGFGTLRRFDYGLNGTAGIEGKSLLVGVNYGLGLAKIPAGTNSSADNTNKHRVLSFSLGIKL